MAVITLIEDDLLLADCYKKWLGTRGHHLQHVTDAQSALDSFDASLPQVILLDMLLPGANGVQLLHALQSHADLARIPVIVCSSATIPAINLQPYGVHKVLDKSTLTRRQLLQAVQEVL